MNKAEVIALAAEIEGAKYDFPFDEDFETVVFRHKDTGRWFGVVLAAPNDRIGVLPESGKSDVLNVKVPPELGVLLKENGFYNQLWCGCEFSIGHLVRKAPEELPEYIRRAVDELRLKE